MKTNIKKFEFNNQEVDFEQTNQNLMVNATQMAKIFGKAVAHFLENDSTKKFITACLINRNSDLLNVKTEEDLVTSVKNKGTWMHRVLALKFAAWLDPDFELWVYCTIDDLLFGHLRQQEESLRVSAARKNKIEQLRDQLRNNELYYEMERLELEERQAAYGRGIGNRNQLDLFRSLDEPKG